MRDGLDEPAALDLVWRYDILPLLHEHFYGSKSPEAIDQEFGLASLRKRDRAPGQRSTGARTTRSADGRSEHESLDELDAEGIEVELDPDAGTAPCASRKLVDVRAWAVTAAIWSLPNGRVGAVRFDDLQIEVPRRRSSGVAHLMFLLGYAKDPGFRPDACIGETYGDLWPAMAHSLVGVGRARARRTGCCRAIDRAGGAAHGPRPHRVRGPDATPARASRADRGELRRVQPRYRREPDPAWRRST